MKKIYRIVLVVLLVAFSVCSSVSAQIFDPAQEYKEELLKYGLDLDTMPIEIEDLGNGDQKIWHVDYSMSFHAWDKERYEWEIHMFGNPEGWTFMIDRDHPSILLEDEFLGFPMIDDGKLVDGIRYYYTLVAGGAAIIGDSNQDAKVDLKDVLTTRMVLAGYDVDKYNPLLADANWDDVVDMKDVLLTRQYVAGIITKLGKE